MLTKKLSKQILSLRASCATRRPLSSLAKFQPDLEYLLDASNREEIKANTSRRRGRGNVDAVADIAKELRVSFRSLCFALIRASPLFLSLTLNKLM